MYYEWEKDFENEFSSLLKTKDNKESKFIIGQEPYKYILNNKDFKVTSKNDPYIKIDQTVAFLLLIGLRYKTH